MVTVRWSTKIEDQRSKIIKDDVVNVDDGSAAREHDGRRAESIEQEEFRTGQCGEDSKNKLIYLRRDRKVTFNKVVLEERGSTKLAKYGEYSIRNFFTGYAVPENYLIHIYTIHM